MNRGIYQRCASGVRVYEISTKFTHFEKIGYEQPVLLCKFENFGFKKRKNENYVEEWIRINMHCLNGHPQRRGGGGGGRGGQLALSGFFTWINKFFLCVSWFKKKKNNSQMIQNN